LRKPYEILKDVVELGSLTPELLAEAEAATYELTEADVEAWIPSNRFGRAVRHTWLQMRATLDRRMDP
jgi:hypothetical protein